MRQTDRGLDLIIPHHAKAAGPACALAILEGDAPPGAQQATRRHPHGIGITSYTVHKAQIQATLVGWQNAQDRLLWQETYRLTQYLPQEKPDSVNMTAVVPTITIKLGVMSEDNIIIIIIIVTWQ